MVYNKTASLSQKEKLLKMTVRYSSLLMYLAIKKCCLWRDFFEYQKAENMQEMNKNLHIFGFLIIWDIEQKHPLV
ncbi:hypothetical protein [Neobacillus drentensis]|uniref:hypothetical protein n=1 Tax=Neobacillus drentensis TaxID=220684 RepID=UPI003001FA38